MNMHSSMFRVEKSMSYISSIAKAITYFGGENWRTNILDP